MEALFGEQVFRLIFFGLGEAGGLDLGRPVRRHGNVLELRACLEHYLSIFWKLPHKSMPQQLFDIGSLKLVLLKT